MAIKYVCDICGKESDAMHQYQLPYPDGVYLKGMSNKVVGEIHNGLFYAKDVDICNECEKKIHSLIKELNQNVV